MNSFLQLFSLPLLTKELIEQAQRRRTYVLRVIGAVVLYSGALIQYADISAGGTTAGLMNLGRGRFMFQLLVMIQFWMILLLLPPITCGAVTVEKEKDTLAILLLTKLTPWTIVFEKFLSRIFAMGTYQLLSLPLFAIIYGLGGVELWELIANVVGLASLTMVVGSVSILCSTWFRTTSAAFVMTYVTLFAFSCFLSVFTPFWLMSRMPPIGMNVFSNTPWLGFILLYIVAPTMIAVAALVPTVVCLYVAAKVLVPRAFIPVRNLVLELFRHADRFFNELNRVTTGGIVLVPDRAFLPDFNPIAWRETRKKSLGTFRYQFRILMLLMTPLIFVIAYVLTDGRSNYSSPFQGFPAFFWIVSIICLTIHSTSSMPSERVRQTLDVILVAPLTSTDIIRQKLAGVRRLIFILSVPFIVLIGFQAIWAGYIIQGTMLWQNSYFLINLTALTLATLIYMPLIMWIGFQLGLRMRTQMQAVLSTIAIVAGICAIPPILTELVSVLVSPIWMLTASEIGGFWVTEALRWVYACIRWLSPIAMIYGTQDLTTYFVLNGVSRPNLEWSILIAHFTFYGFLWWRLRSNAMRNFSRIVKRLEPSGHDEELEK